MIHSKKYSLNWHDIVKGLIMAFGSGFLTALLDALTSQTFNGFANWKVYVGAGAIGAITYLLKNFFTNSDGKLKTEPKKEIK